jgi:hypothetical protein
VVGGAADPAVEPARIDRTAPATRRQGVCPSLITIPLTTIRIMAQDCRARVAGHVDQGVSWMASRRAR